MSLNKIINDCLSLQGPDSIGLQVKPGFKIFFSKQGLNDNQATIERLCDLIPEESLTGVHTLKRHTEQSPFYSYALMAIAKHFGIWNVFPDAKLIKDCNVDFFPSASKVKAPSVNLKNEETFTEENSEED